MKAYFAFFKIELIQGLHHRAATFGRFGFYAVILFIFSRLWHIVADKIPLAMSPGDLIWYLAMTELIILSYPLVHLEIEEDVRTGTLAYFISKPCSYLWSRYFRALGTVYSRTFVLIFAGLIFSYLFAGGFPSNPKGLLLFLPLAALSIAVGLIFLVTIGIFSFWIEDSSPLHWVWQKMSFILGGMMLPLDIYPSWLKKIAEYSPFSALLYSPAKASITLNYEMALASFIKLIFWGLMAFVFAEYVYRKAVQQVSYNGG